MLGPARAKKIEIWSGKTIVKYENTPKSEKFEAESEILAAKSETFEAKRSKTNPKSQKKNNLHALPR